MTPISPKFGQITIFPSAVTMAYAGYRTPKHLGPLINPTQDNSMAARVLNALDQAGVDILVTSQPLALEETNGPNTLVVETRKGKGPKTSHYYSTANTLPEKIRQGMIWQALGVEAGHAPNTTLTKALDRQGFDVLHQDGTYREGRQTWSRHTSVIVDRQTHETLVSSSLR